MANLLHLEDSPYLQQHKDNPLHWFPWSDEAFAKAKDQNKPIFISIGYSSCHWCHVMEHEVFENEDVAKFMNETFVCIKVDREERPDIDKHYQELHQLLNQRAGGWPLSIFVTPDVKPIYAATYMPVESDGQRIGFEELTKIISEKVQENDEKLFQNADEIMGFMKPAERPTEASKLKDALAVTYVKQCSQNFESNFGGFSVTPKFPQTSTLNTLLDIHQLFGNEEALSMLSKTMDTMHLGGIYDVVDGGFCRYSVDEQWLVPHFEKMTYDNALLIQLYTKAGLALQNHTYLHTAVESANFMLEFMFEDNQFFSASDADTEGIEGKYFIYDYEETKAHFIKEGFEDVEKILEKLSITASGNFEGDNIVRIEHGSKFKNFEAIQKSLSALRKDRVYPFIDKKVITAWNAMMIKALFDLSKHDKVYKNIAINALDTLLENMYKNNKLMHSALIGKEAKVSAFLEDYAYLGTALVTAYETTFDEVYLIKAQQIANQALENFYDQGKWFFSRGEFETEADATDSSYPGAIGVIADLLLSIAIHSGEDKYRLFAFKTIEYSSFKLGKNPMRHPYLFNQALRYLKEDRVIKATEKNLEILSNIRYPYAHLHASDESESEYMICGYQSCFANTADINEINEKIFSSIPPSED